jgi:hypothetical protein
MRLLILLFKLRIQIHIDAKRTIKILQQLMLHILLAQERILCRNHPINAKRVILNADATICLRGIEFPRQLLTDAIP